MKLHISEFIIKAVTFKVTGKHCFTAFLNYVQLDHNTVRESGSIYSRHPSTFSLKTERELARFSKIRLH